MKDLKKVLVGSAAFSVLGIISLYGGSASAATINVQDETELRNAIDQVNTSITKTLYFLLRRIFQRQQHLL